jgi:anti-sigma B factor antagonist
MQIVERRIGDVAILDLHGKIPGGEGEKVIREAVNRLVDSGTANILVNCADVSYLDSSVVGEIVRALTTVSRTGGQLKLLSVPARIRSLLAMTRLLTIFEVYDSEDEALRAFQTGSA